MKRYTRLSVLLTVSALVGCGSQEPPDPPPPGNHNEALQRLGVTTAVEARGGLDGKPLPADYNPLNRKRRPLKPIYEVYLAGPAAPTGIREILLGDASEGYAVLDTGYRDDTWAHYPKVSTAGDFDGDGREEVALLVLNNDKASPDYKKLFLRVVEDKAEGWAAKVKPIATVGDAEMSQIGAAIGNPYLKLDIAAGDIDGDGKDELAVTCVSDLWVLDDRDAADSYGILLTRKLAPPSGVVNQFVRVAAGETDGDARAELVVVDSQMTSSTAGTVQYHIYEGLEEKTQGQVKVDSPKSSELMTADVSIGDVDGDRLGEIVFSGRQSGSLAQHKILVMDDAMGSDLTGSNMKAGYTFLALLYEYTPIYQSELLLHRVETGDFDGDNAAEIVSFDQILDDIQGGKGLVKKGTLPHDVGWGTLLTVGDINNDRKEEIIFGRGTDPDSLLVIVGTEDSNSAYVKLHTIDLADGAPYPTLTTVNTDDDSPIVEFQGHEVRFTSPRILAVMAAPPSYKNLPTDNAQAGTMFGKGTGSTVQKETSLGVMVGWSTHVEAHFLVASGSITSSIEASLDVISSESKTIEKAYYYTGTADSDKVVFAAIPFDLYYYKVVSSPKPDEVGMHLVVNIPRPPQILFVDREFFNRNNGSFPDIDGTVLGHTIGEPRSYPREASVDKAGLARNGGFYSAGMTVGQGMGSQTASINSSESKSLGLKFDLNTKVEAKGGVDVDIALVKASAQGGPMFGFHFGYSYTVSSSMTTYYAGSVGNIINGSDWTNNRFDFGLYVQPTVFEGQKFPLINYWVN